MGVADLLSKKKKALAEKNLKEGQEFQAAFGAKEGVVTLESGLQYEVLEASEGKSLELKILLSAIIMVQQSLVRFSIVL
jgi:FKBP-type peptidyl-prolyl cis-trans isomerase FklB